MERDDFKIGDIGVWRIDHFSEEECFTLYLCCELKPNKFENIERTIPVTYCLTSQGNAIFLYETHINVLKNLREM